MSLDDFDPNTRPQKPWATYCPHRNPQFKMHAQRGHALSGLGNNGSGILYEWVDNRWREVARKDPRLKQDSCFACGSDVMKSRMDWQKKLVIYNSGCLVPLRASGKLVFPLQFVTVCNSCAYNMVP